MRNSFQSTSFRVGLGQRSGIPVGLGAVAALLDSRDLAQHAGAEQLAAAGAGGPAADLGAHLAARCRAALTASQAPLERLDVHGQRLLAVDVLARPWPRPPGAWCAGGRRRRSSRRRRRPGPGCRGRRRTAGPGGRTTPGTARRPPRAACRQGSATAVILDVLLLGVRVDARHVGPAAAAAAADHADRDALVGPHDPGVAGGRDAQGGGAERGGLEELAAGSACIAWRGVLQSRGKRRAVRAAVSRAADAPTAGGMSVPAF